MKLLTRPQLLTVLLTVLVGGMVGAQVPPHMVEEGRRMQGDRVRFCVNADGLTVDFDRELATELAQAQLLDSEIYAASAFQYSLALDYRPNFTEDEIYMLLADYCEAFMGFTLSSEYADWLTVGRPYLITRSVAVVASDDYTSLNDVPAGEAVGARYLSAADIQLATLLRTLPAEERWRRVSYPNNELLLERLLDGTLTAVIIWEPALAAATAGDPEEYGIRIIPSGSLRPPEVQFVIALRARDTFLRSLLDEAVVALTEDGVVQRLLDEHGIPGRPAGTGR
jgi:polar amino acid transport system substrate-binding protein